MHRTPLISKHRVSACTLHPVSCPSTQSTSGAAYAIVVPTKQLSNPPHFSFQLCRSLQSNLLKLYYSLVDAISSSPSLNMARRLLTSAAPLLTRRPPTPALATIPCRTFALSSSSTHTAASSMTGQSAAGGANNQAAGSSTGINANQQGQKQASPHSTQPTGDKDVTQRPATSSPTGGAGMGVGAQSTTSEMAGSYSAQADKQGGKLGQGMGDKHTNEVHKDRAGKGVVPGTGNATSGDETIGGTGNAGSQDAGTSMDKVSQGSKGSTAGSKSMDTSSSGRRGFATKAGGANSGATSSTGNTTSVSGIGSAPTSASKTSNSSSGSTTGKSNGSQASGAGATASAAGTTGSGSSSGGAKSNLGIGASGGASTTNSTNSPGMGGAGSAGSSASSGTSGSSGSSGSSSSSGGSGLTGATGKSNTPAGGSSDTKSDGTTVQSTSGQAGGIGSTGSPRVGGSAGGGAARANTGEHSPSGTAGGVGTGGTTMESVKEKVRDYTGDVSANMPAASSYTVIAAVLLGVPLLFVMDPDRAFLKKKHIEREKEIMDEYH